MLSSINLSAESISLLKNRGRTDQQVEDFSVLLDKANEQLQQSASAKQVLAAMSQEDLELVQRSVGLADRIRVSTLSDEGARNLLAQPDKTGMVDLNNDGLVEVGAAKMMTFPPVNAPASVHSAWEEATAGLSFEDQMMLQMDMHIQTYGVMINDQFTKDALPPEQQWSKEGWQSLLADARSALEFAVSIEGWDRFNIVKKEFYDNFEQALGRVGSEPNETAA